MLEKGRGGECGEGVAVVTKQRRPVRRSRVKVLRVRVNLRAFPTGQETFKGDGFTQKAVLWESQGAFRDLYKQRLNQKLKLQNT